MTGDCTYLAGEKTLPKCSLLYEEFCVLNELNGVRWSEDGDDWHRLDAAQREGIITDLFHRKRRVTYKNIGDWLVQQGEATAPPCQRRPGRERTRVQACLVHPFSPRTSSRVRRSSLVPSSTRISRPSSCGTRSLRIARFSRRSSRTSLVLPAVAFSTSRRSRPSARSVSPAGAGSPRSSSVASRSRRRTGAASPSWTSCARATPTRRVATERRW